MSRRQRCNTIWTTMAVVLACAPQAVAQLDFEAAPIHYETARVTDRVTRLQQRIDRGAVQLAYDRTHGYLPAVLEHLKVPVSSQMLVFSKTSFQQQRISPDRPRAVYFSDDVYVGAVQQGDVVEVSAADPHQGAIFYTLRQSPTDSPRFVRDRGQCISCHASSRTDGVPGHLVRSVYADATGQPIFGGGTFTTDHRSPLNERWGGWYVTGTHGTQRHMGNTIAEERDHRIHLDAESGANVTELHVHFDTSRYLSPHSDIVALMVLEHQTRMHNLITRANFETRAAVHYDDVLNRTLDRAETYRSDSAERRIAAAGDKLVEGLLFADEARLEGPIAGTSAFAAEFAARGPFDASGRSLRQFDLERRMMKYPCSHLIYSRPFARLPGPMKEYVYRRLFEVLHGSDRSERFAHLTASDRQAILEILRETKPGLPAYFEPIR